MPIFQALPPSPFRLHAAPAHTHNNKTISASSLTESEERWRGEIMDKGGAKMVVANSRQ